VVALAVTGTGDPERGTRQEPMATPFVPHGRARMPGPTRRFDRRHFARLEGGGMVVLAIVALVIVLWVGIDIGMLPDWFGWRH
jgi:hypothetical protein